MKSLEPEMSASLNVEKYENALLYFFTHCNNHYLGSTKLNKLMYYLDFVSFRDTQSSVTGDSYIHLEYGPVPKAINNMLVMLKEGNKVAAKDMPYKDGHKREFKATTEPDLTVFSAYEQRLLEAICQEFQLWDTPKIVDQTHLESPWLYSEPLEAVDYGYASDIDLFTGLLDGRTATSPAR